VNLVVSTGSGGTPAVVSVNPNNATGLSNTFALTYSDTAGYASLNVVAVVFGSGVSASNSCYVLYYPASNLLHLDNNAGTGSTSIAPGASGTLSNSQCTITGSGTTVVTSGNNLTLNLDVTASSTYTSKQNIYMKANDNSGASSGWVNEGTWTPAGVAVPNVVGDTQAAATTAITGAGLVVGTVTNQGSSTVTSGDVISESPVAGTSVSAGSAVNLVVSTGSGGTPGVVSVNPNNATGLSNTFALTYSDTGGYASLNVVAVVFGSGLSASNSCYVLYYPASNLLRLDNNAGTGSTSITPGSGTISNSQCTINGSGTSVVTSGNDLTLNLAVTASSTYTSEQNIYMKANDNSGATSGWVNEGTWAP
jgi:phenylacetate-coenzyme A ligase PaaK-like adenylate-forming protein